MSESADAFRFFDPLADLDITESKLPHWMQSKTVCFITWRTWDSMPAEVVERWHTERKQWLARHQMPKTHSFSRALSEQARREYYRLFSARWEAYLDDCLGSCPLRRPDCAEIVASSLRFFDGQRYLLTDFVVMPNHVHVLAAFDDASQMLKQCNSWKHFTATELNKILGRKGRFWEPESFDHLVRSQAQWEYLRGFVKENSERPGLRKGEFIHYSREF